MAVTECEVNDDRPVAHFSPKLKLVHKKKVSRIRRQILKHPIPPKKTKRYVAEEIHGTSSSAKATFQTEIYVPHRPTTYLTGYQW